jgi:hypothetical protein
MAHRPRYPLLVSKAALLEDALDLPLLVWKHALRQLVEPSARNTSVFAASTMQRKL